jgi:hypothetical protein
LNSSKYAEKMRSCILENSCTSNPEKLQKVLYKIHLDLVKQEFISQLDQFKSNSFVSLSQFDEMISWTSKLESSQLEQFLLSYESISTVYSDNHQIMAREILACMHA